MKPVLILGRIMLGLANSSFYYPACWQVRFLLEVSKNPMCLQR